LNYHLPFPCYVVALARAIFLYSLFCAPLSLDKERGLPAGAQETTQPLHGIFSSFLFCSRGNTSNGHTLKASSEERQSAAGFLSSAKMQAMCPFFQAAFLVVISLSQCSFSVGGWSSLRHFLFTSIPFLGLKLPLLLCFSGGLSSQD